MHARQDRRGVFYDYISYTITAIICYYFSKGWLRSGHGDRAPQSMEYRIAPNRGRTNTGWLRSGQGATS